MAEDLSRTRIRLLQSIHDLQPAYQLAVKAVKEWEPPSLLYDAWNKLDAYQPGDSPEKAIYIVAMCRTTLEPFARSYSAIRNYEEARRKLEEYDRRKEIENG